MADQTQIVTVPLVPGLHEDIDRTTAPPGTLVAAANCRVRKGGISKRNGLVDAGVTAFSGTFAGPCDALGFAAGRQIAVMAGNAWARENTGDTWQIVGRSSRARPVATHWQGFPGLHASCATNSSYVIFALDRDASEVLLFVQDNAGIRRQFARFTGRDRPRVFLVGTTFVLVMRESAGTGIYGVTINGSTLSVAAQVLITARQSSSDVFDAAPFTSTKFLVAYRATATSFTTDLVDLSFGTTATQSVVCAAATVNACTVYGIDTVGAWVTFDDQSAQKMAAFNAGLTATTGAVTSFASSEGALPAVMTQRDSTSVWLAYQEVTGSPTRYLLHIEARGTDAAVVSGIHGYANHLRVASRPWNGGTTSFQMWVHTDNGQASEAVALGAWSTQRKYALCTMLMDLDVPSAFGMIVEPEFMPDETALEDISFHVPEVAFRSTTDAVGNAMQSGYFPALSVIRTQQSSQGKAAALLYEWETESGFEARARQVVEVGGQGLVAGGGLQELPSSRLTDYAIGTVSRGMENGFLFSPAILDADPSAGAGLTSGGVYQFFAIFEYITADGLRQQSAPSNIVVVTPSGGNLQVTLKITSSPTTEREFASPPCATVLHVYATIANGDTFQRVTSDSGTASLGTISSGIITYVHSTADATVADNEPAYTEGGAPANQPCPAHRFAWSGGGRLAVGGLFNPRIVEFSKLALPSEPIRFTRNGLFRCLLPEAATGGIWLDNQHVIFSRTGIYLVPLTGADDVSPGVGQAQRLPSTVGCVDFRGVVELPGGVGFQSERGYEILPRGFGEPRLISGPVQESLRGRRVTSATVTGHSGAPFGSAERVGERLLVLSAMSGRYAVPTDSVDVVGVIIGFIRDATSEENTLKLQGGFGSFINDYPAMIDGNTLSQGDRVLCLGTVNPSAIAHPEWDGVYIITSEGGDIDTPLLTRDPDLDSGAELDATRNVDVEDGTVYGGLTMTLQTEAPIVVNTTELEYAEGDFFATDGGIRLVYDLEFDRWLSTDQPASDIFGDPGTLGERLTTWDGRLVVGRRGDTVLRYESPTDWGTVETGSLAVSVADVRPFGAMARGRMHRLQLLGEIRSEAVVSGSLYFDGEYSKPFALETRRVQGVKGDKFMVEWELPTNELGALGVDLTVESAVSTSQGEDLVLHSLGVESSSLAGRPRLAQDRR